MPIVLGASQRFSWATLQAGHEPSPIQGYTRTLSPTLNPLTDSPIASIFPDISCQGVIGNLTPLSSTFKKVPPAPA